jgi:hypothetical protein
LVTYRPSLLAGAVHDTITAHLLARTEVEEERYFVEGLLGTRGPAGVRPVECLAELRMPRAGLLTQTAAGPRWQTFLPGARLSAHVHHSRKYVDAILPAEKAFRFVVPGGGVVRSAFNVRDFADAVAEVPLASLQRHLVAGDFSRWAHDVLGDAALAGGLAKLERTVAAGAAPSRTEILRHLHDRYVL